ncbi:MAG: AlwI family type II restriction endonuclease [Bacilli bacterium]|nr:AlwI family type II restriction endonuclease [Bacilli bacterium]
MIVERNQIFNLMDTNGRRSDVLNALKIYLEILEELKEIYPTESWGTYPASLSQFLFYEKALEKSKDVFKIHSNYDSFIDELGDDYQTFIDRDGNWIENNITKFAKVLDEAIEKRARHYTSNLVKMGFTTTNRSITEAGYSYLRGSVVRDELEELLPLDNVNIALFRQLSKLKIFDSSNNGKRRFYSPFIMALILLLDNETIDEHSFEVVVQGLSPYSSDEVKEAIRNNEISIAELEESIRNIDITIPEELIGKYDIDFDVFKNIFKGSKKNDSISKLYYDFFSVLRDFRNNKTEETYANLINCLDQDNIASIYKAFGYGKAVFAAGNKGSRYKLERFLEKNANHPLLISEDFVSEFYTAYTRSKWIDGIREYSDTTIRLLSATGLFKFKNLPELSYKEILSLIFDVEQLRKNVFGEMTDEEYTHYEETEDSYFGKNIPFVEIFNYSHDDISTITSKLKKLLGVSAATDVKKFLNDQKNADFIAHINDKYPKEKIMELLPMFSDRKKDNQIKKEVNDAATVPTIYEYIIGIAWYYISNKEFDLYNSLNLTLNADFEPVIHAGGGDGDIVIHYEEIIIMLEVTLMNKQAQKRGEWEPVLRHSLNLKAANEPTETITFFIADELDYNTINIWRAVASVSLESTNTHTKVDGVVIMPFTNNEVLAFLKNSVYYKDIVKAVKDSFAKVPQITDVKWHEEIMSNLIS